MSVDRKDACGEGFSRRFGGTHVLDAKLGKAYASADDLRADRQRNVLVKGQLLRVGAQNLGLVRAKLVEHSENPRLEGNGQFARV